MKETKSWRSLLTVVLLLGGWLMAQAATSYGITVGGVPVTSDDASNITGSTISGKVSYNATTKRLTLKDASITYTSGYGIGNNGCEGLEIYIDGMCSVKGTFALNCNATTTVKGKYPETLNGQSVDLIGTISPVYVANDKTLTFSHVMVSTTGSTSSGAIRGGGKAALAFTKSTVFIDANESDPCVSGFTSCTMTECEAGRRLKDMGPGLNVVRMSDGTVKKVVTK